MINSKNMATHLWLRCETKEFEHRSALTPTTAKKLLDEGFKITVERDPNRIFDDEEFARWVLLFGKRFELIILI